MCCVNLKNLTLQQSDFKIGKTFVGPVIVRRVLMLSLEYFLSRKK